MSFALGGERALQPLPGAVHQRVDPRPVVAANVVRSAGGEHGGLGVHQTIVQGDELLAPAAFEGVRSPVFFTEITLKRTEEEGA